MKRYVQYGCGFSAPDGWVNYDASPTLRFERLPLLGKMYTRNSQRFPENVKYGDIVKGLPENAGSCDGVYCSHILEHLSYNDFQAALRNTLKIMKPGAVFRGVVPDLRASIIDYMQNSETSEAPANEFMQSTMLGIEYRHKGLTGMLGSYLGNSKHLWMWDYKTLEFELRKTGFTAIRECVFNDSADMNFLLVEDEGRFYKAAAFECQK